MTHALNIVWNPSEGIDLGFFIIRFYSLMFVIAFGLGWYIMKNIYERENESIENLDSLFIWTVLATLIGARLGHVIFYDWEYYTPGGILVPAYVKDVAYTFVDRWNIIRTDKGDVRGNGEHPMMIFDINEEVYKFKPLGLLQPGDRLIKVLGENQIEEVEIIANEVQSSTLEVVSIDVEDAGYVNLLNSSIAVLSDTFVICFKLGFVSCSIAIYLNNIIILF